jgi:hypothetical protein
MQRTVTKTRPKRKKSLLPRVFTINMKGASPFAAVAAIGLAVSTIFAYAKQLDAEFNTPEMIQARRNVARQEAMDALARAQASNDIEAERKAVESTALD